MKMTSSELVSKSSPKRKKLFTFPTSIPPTSLSPPPSASSQSSTAKLAKSKSPFCPQCKYCTSTEPAWSWCRTGIICWTSSTTSITCPSTKASKTLSTKYASLIWNSRADFSDRTLSSLSLVSLNWTLWSWTISRTGKGRSAWSQFLCQLAWRRMRRSRGIFTKLSWSRQKMIWRRDLSISSVSFGTRCTTMTKWRKWCCSWTLTLNSWNWKGFCRKWTHRYFWIKFSLRRFRSTQNGRKSNRGCLCSTTTVTGFYWSQKERITLGCVR